MSFFFVCKKFHVVLSCTFYRGVKPVLSLVLVYLEGYTFFKRILSS